ncbi:hypothetical protein M747DRAFT_116831 [Aspergillus niger ATCC 13496]|uniref:Uncharacterized protein n=1 Tax=Aspergillus niger ATCC 13496 TaxID=1353008 RepID=A0A370CCR8_ASPNG|nr:hypothetical protein M747DRAFT_116831 [Aspergillus niger ATCC 13496]
MSSRKQHEKGQTTCKSGGGAKRGGNFPPSFRHPDSWLDAQICRGSITNAGKTVNIRTRSCSADSHPHAASHLPCYSSSSIVRQKLSCRTSSGEVESIDSLVSLGPPLTLRIFVPITRVGMGLGKVCLKSPPSAANRRILGSSQCCWDPLSMVPSSGGSSLFRNLHPCCTQVRSWRHAFLVIRAKTVELPCLFTSGKARIGSQNIRAAPRSGVMSVIFRPAGQLESLDVVTLCKLHPSRLPVGISSYIVVVSDMPIPRS